MPSFLAFCGTNLGVKAFMKLIPDLLFQVANPTDLLLFRKRVERVAKDEAYDLDSGFALFHKIA